MKKHRILKKIFSKPSSPQKIVITTHKKPDGDALGSTLALGHLCRSLGHQVEMISPTIIPRYLKWLPGIEQLTIAEKADESQIRKMIADADVIFCLDIGKYDRLGLLTPWIKESSTTVITIDHHPGLDETVADLTITDTNMPATVIMIYDMLLEMALEDYITPSIATYLYLGILTDTGGFINANTNAKAHQTTAELIKKGADIGRINHELQSNTPLNKLRFIAHLITNRLFVNQKQGFAYIAIPSKDFISFKLKTGDTGGLINYALNIQGIVVAVMLTEQKNASVNLSFRSFGDRHVNELAKKHFQGGGHKNAAGGTSKLTLKETVAKLERILIETAKKD